MCVILGNYAFMPARVLDMLGNPPNTVMSLKNMIYTCGYVFVRDHTIRLRGIGTDIFEPSLSTRVPIFVGLF